MMSCVDVCDERLASSARATPRSPLPLRPLLQLLLLHLLLLLLPPPPLLLLLPLLPLPSPL